MGNIWNIVFLLGWEGMGPLEVSYESPLYLREGSITKLVSVDGERGKSFSVFPNKILKKYVSRQYIKQTI